MRAWVGSLLLFAACGGSEPGVCQGNFCGQGECVGEAACSDTCKRMPIAIGDRCPAGYGCLGLLTCISKDGSVPTAPDLRVVRDMTMVDLAVEDMAVSLDDGATDGATDGPVDGSDDASD